MKHFSVLFLAALLVLLTVLPVAAMAPLVVDDAALLTQEELDYLTALAQAEGDRHDISIVILTADGIGGEDPMMYAADYYDYNGYLEDGVILFLDMGERDWRIVNSGFLMDTVGNYELDYIESYVVPYFSSGDYATGFEQFILVVSAITDYNTHDGTYTSELTLPDYEPEGYYTVPGNELYDDSYYYGENGYDYGEGGSYEIGIGFYAVAFGIALLVAFLVCCGFKAQLNTAVPARQASNYLNEDRCALTHQADRFLYSQTHKTRRQTESSSSSSGGGMRSFSSSSGRSHTGGGGKF